MHYSENGIYCISGAAFNRWKYATDSVNGSIANIIGINKWMPVEFDGAGRVVKIKLENGDIITNESIKDDRVELSCLFTVSELENGTVIHVGTLEETTPADANDRYFIFEISQFIKPAPVVKDGRSVFTLEEVKEIILELTDTVPETVKYEVFKSTGLAEIKTTKIVEVGNV
ncbi:hypothetical protein CPT_Metamorpho_063 [Klebsiella phage Metamorpho]|nr:hypothetical protein CPT_Metamorpho_063 [Klebsiella phage Metamorpho]